MFEGILRGNNALLPLFDQLNKQGKTPFDYAVEHRQTRLVIYGSSGRAKTSGNV